MIDIQKLRADTPGTRSRIHFNNAGSSLPPDPVTRAIKEYIDFESREGGYEAADERGTEIHGFYEAAGQLIGCDAKNIAFTSSATNSFARALSSIPFSPGDSILIANEDYISNQIQFLSLVKRFNITLVRARSLTEGGVDVEDMARLMDEHNPVLVSLTHVPTNSGLVQPVEAVGKLCKEKNIPYLVDACQSVGQIPVDVNNIHCDFLGTTMRKFLRGPRGAGFLYVSDNALEKGFEPMFIDMRGADWTAADQYKPRGDAGRFEDWEFPYALVMGSKAALEYALDIGVPNIAARNKDLCFMVRNKLEKEGLRILDIGKNLSSIITVEIPGKSPEEAIGFLRNRKINTSASKLEYAQIDFKTKGVEWALRISPHYYNTEEEVESLVEALRDLTKKK